MSWFDEFIDDRSGSAVQDELRAEIDQLRHEMWLDLREREQREADALAAWEEAALDEQVGQWIDDAYAQLVDHGLTPTEIELALTSAVTSPPGADGLPDLDHAVETSHSARVEVAIDDWESRPKEWSTSTERQNLLADRVQQIARDERELDRAENPRAYEQEDRRPENHDERVQAAMDRMGADG